MFCIKIRYIFFSFHLRPPDVSQSFPPPNSLQNQSGSPKPPMKTVQEDGSSWNPQLAQGQGLWNDQASLQNLGYNQGAVTNEAAASLSANPVETAKPAPPAADIFIPPIGKTSADKTLPKEASPPPVTKQKQDLQPIQESGPVKAQGGIKTQPVGNGKGKGPAVLKKTTKQHSPQNARGGYASKGKYSQGAGKKVAKKPSQHEGKCLYHKFGMMYVTLFSKSQRLRSVKDVCLVTTLLSSLPIGNITQVPCFWPQTGEVKYPQNLFVTLALY